MQTVTAITTALTTKAAAGRTPNGPVHQAQQVRIGVRLLVVLAAPALQTAVLDRAVVAHLRQLQIRQVLSDALVDLLVVVDAIRARRDEQRERQGQRRQTGHPQSIAPARDA